jgi:hypothetical protein
MLPHRSIDCVSGYTHSLDPAKPASPTRRQFRKRGTHKPRSGNRTPHHAAIPKALAPRAARWCRATWAQSRGWPLQALLTGEEGRMRAYKPASAKFRHLGMPRHHHAGQPHHTHSWLLFRESHLQLARPSGCLTHRACCAHHGLRAAGLATPRLPTRQCHEPSRDARTSLKKSPSRQAGLDPDPLFRQSGQPLQLASTSVERDGLGGGPSALWKQQRGMVPIAQAELPIPLETNSPTGCT